VFIKKCWKFALQGITHCRYFPTSFFSTSSWSFCLTARS
jgi:hypothetical protein